MNLMKFEALTSELASGRISLNSLASELNLTIHQVRLVLQYLLNMNRISGILTYGDTFISNVTLKKEIFTAAQARKRNYRFKRARI